MPISPDEIAGKRFVVTLRGYDRAEVDSYLRALAADQARLLDRIRELQAPAAGRAPDEGGAGAPEAMLDQAIDALTRLRRSLGDAPAARRAARPAKSTKASPAPAKSTKTSPTPAKSTKASPTPAKSTKASPTPAKSTKASPTPAKSTKARPTPAKSTKARPTPAKSAKAVSGRAGSASGRQGAHKATARGSRSAG